MAFEIDRRTFIGLGPGALAAMALPKTVLAAGDDGEGFSFVQLTDTHLPDPPGLAATRRVVKAINKLSLPCEFIVHTGDVSSNGYKNPENLAAARQELRFDKKAFFVPGNNDVSLEQPRQYTPAFEKIFGPANYAFSTAAGIRFCLFNSLALSDEAGDAAREEALAILDQLLIPSQPTILLCHIVGLPDFYENRFHNPGWPAARIEGWVERMKAGGVLAVISGHFHRDELHHRGGLPLFVTAPVSTYFGRQPSFRLWTFAQGVLSYRTIYV